MMHGRSHGSNCTGMNHTHTTTLIVLLQLFLLGHAFAKIRNGYAHEIPSALETLYNLKSHLAREPDLPTEQRKWAELKIRVSINLITSYEVTEELLNRLKEIAPEIYYEMDMLKDRRGRPTDIYVRLNLDNTATQPHHAASFFSTATSVDADANVSVYGPFSVAVNIWRMDNALLLLCHELGHVRHIVPNLAEYSKFYKRQYSNRYANLSYIGHHNRDKSGKLAKKFEVEFLSARSAWKKNNNDRHGSLYTMSVQIRKDLRNADLTHRYRQLSRQVAKKEEP